MTTKTDEKTWTLISPAPIDAEVYRRNGTSVQFVKGVAKVTDDLAIAVEFPTGDAFGEPFPFSPGEALARQLVSDFGYECDPPLARLKEPMRARDYFRQGIDQTPLPAGLQAGADPRVAITRREDDAQGKPITQRVRPARAGI